MLKYKIILEKDVEFEELPLIEYTYYDNKTLFRLVFEGIKEDIDPLIVNFVENISNLKEKPNIYYCGNTGLSIVDWIKKKRKISYC